MMLDRTVAPPFSRTLDFTLPPPVSFANIGTCKGYVVPSNDHQVVKVELILQAGKVTERQTGASYFTAQLLDKGTATKSSADIAAALDYYGSHFDVEAGSDLLHVNVYALTRHLKHVLPLVADMLAQPAFAEEEMRIAREIFEQNLRVNLEKTSFLASRGLRQLLFGEHPYGSSIGQKELEALTPDVVRQHFDAHASIHRLYVTGCVEDADLAALTKIVEQHSAAGKTGEVALPPTMTNGGDARHIIKKDSIQASIRMGKLALARGDQDYPLLLLTNHVLGGYFGSRLMKNIREEKGLSYGIYSSVQHHTLASTISIGADVNRAQMDLALEEIKKELVALQEVGTDELTTARNHFIGSLQNDVSNVFAAAERLKVLDLDGLPADYFTHLIQRIDAATPGDLARMAAKYFDPAGFVTVTAG